MSGFERVHYWVGFLIFKRNELRNQCNWSTKTSKEAIDVIQYFNTRNIIATEKDCNGKWGQNFTNCIDIRTGKSNEMGTMVNQINIQACYYGDVPNLFIY